MTELIKISENNGKQAVSLKELHNFLEIKTEPILWAKRMFEYGFVENVDYTALKNERSDNKQVIISDYALTLDCAKEISMLQKNEKGKQARQYFLECEKRMNSKPALSQAQIILQSAQMLVDIENRQLALESRITEIENRPQINAPIEHFSIMGYCHNIGKQISLEQAKTYGLKCRKLCSDLGFSVGKVPDPRYGTVNTYPLSVLQEVIK